MALAGNDVLAEAVITPKRQHLYTSTFDEIPIILIGVKCPLEIAMQRERARTDRRHGPIDLPADDYEAVHVGLSYDFEVDTSVDTPEELTGHIISHLEELVPSDFKSHLSMD